MMEQFAMLMKEADKWRKKVRFMFIFFVLCLSVCVALLLFVHLFPRRLCSFVQCKPLSLCQDQSVFMICIVISVRGMLNFFFCAFSHFDQSDHVCLSVFASAELL